MDELGKWETARRMADGHGRCEWAYGAAGWQIRRVEVLREDVTSRVSFSLGRGTPAA